MSKYSSRAGNKSISNSGDNNDLTLINFEFADRIPKRTVIYDLCKLIATQDITSGEYSIKENADWIMKLEYNDVKEYTEIFDEYCDIYPDFEEILKDQYFYREKMVKKVHHIYRSIRINYSENRKNGDFILQQVFNELKKLVDSANYNPIDQQIEEDIDKTLILIMFYTLTKCKLLEIPENRVEYHDY